MTVGQLILALAAEWRRIATWVVLAGVAGGVLVLLMPPTYQAAATFYPEQAAGPPLPANLTKLARDVGIPVAAGVEAASPVFYATLAKSASVLQPLLADSFRTRDSALGRQPLLDLLGVRKAASVVRMREGERSLDRMIDVSVLGPTNVLAVRVSSRDPVLATELANAVVRRVDRVSTEKLGALARAQRVFAEAREQRARAQLRGAEDALRTFVTRNPQFQRASALRLRHDELQRDVQLAQDLYGALIREAEGARFQEQRAMPILTVIDSAQVPVRHASPHRVALGLIIMALAAVFAVLGVAAREVITARIAQGDHELERLRTWWRQSTDGVLLRRILRRGRRADAPIP